MRPFILAILVGLYLTSCAVAGPFGRRSVSGCANGMCSVPEQQPVKSGGCQCGCVARIVRETRIGLSTFQNPPQLLQRVGWVRVGRVRVERSHHGIRLRHSTIPSARRLTASG